MNPFPSPRKALLIWKMKSPLKKNALAVLLTSGVTMACQLLLVRVLLQHLGRERYGLYVLVSTVGGYVLLLTPNIMIGAAKRLTERLHVDDPVGAERYQRAQVALTLACAALGYAAFAVFALLYRVPGGGVERGEIIALFAACSITLPIVLLSQVVETVLSATDNFGRSSLSSAIDKCVGVAVCLLLVRWWPRPEMIFLGVGFGNLLGILLSIQALVKKRIPLSLKPGLYPEEMRDLLRLSLLGYPHKMMSGVANSADRALLPYSGLPLGRLTDYALAYRIPEAAQNLLNPVTSVLVPKITRAAATHPEELPPMMDRYGLLFLAAGVSLVVPVSAFGQPLVRMWLGTVPPGVPLAMAFVGVYFVGQIYISIMTKPFYALGNLHHSALFQTYNAGLTVALTIPVASAAGIVGVAAMNAGISLTQILPFVLLVRKRCVPGFPVRAHLRRVSVVIAAGGALSAACYAVSMSPALVHSPWLSLLAAPTASAIAGGAFAALGYLPNPLTGLALARSRGTRGGAA